MNERLCSVEKQDDITILNLALDNLVYEENADLMKSFDALFYGGHKKIILDFSKTAYVSSLILASLVYMQKRAKDGGGNLIFCQVKGRVKEILSMTNLDKVFDITNTKEEALAQLGKK